jgi:hypothetical protein
MSEASQIIGYAAQLITYISPFLVLFTAIILADGITEFFINLLKDKKRRIRY